MNTLRAKRGFTLVEAVMAMLVVSILLVAALRATGGSARIQYKNAERATARMLADSMMSDVLTLPYEDPYVTPLFGRESGETTSSKSNYDDLDDFNGWTEAPPQWKDGSTMSNLSGWRVTVTVDRVRAATPTATTSTESGAKRVTVKVLHNGYTVLTKVAFKVAAT